MPNLCEPPMMGMVPQLVDFKLRAFQKMFVVDDDGRCRLQCDRAEWNRCIQNHRDDWESRLVQALVNGTPKDFEDAKPLLRKHQNL